MPEERRSVVSTYGPLFLAVLLTALGSYISAKVQITQIEERLVDAQESVRVLTDIVLTNTRDVSELKGKATCKN